MYSTVGRRELEERLAVSERALAQSRERVDELLREATRREEASLARRVRAFHLRFGHPVRWTPAVPSEAEVRFRLALITEEYFELCAAVFDLETACTAMHLFQDVLRSAPVRVDLPAAVDALADLDYVVEGTRAVLGVNGSPVAEAVHAANMAKDPVYVAHKDAYVGGHRDEPVDGASREARLFGTPDPQAKPVKPPGWAPPDVAGLLREQGWTP